ncbi:MAG: NAD-dependent protein deacylase [Planctomycetota bacterium]|nr:NAD-dependent protein deacylase [Planctomycetota bacterium]
MDRFHPEKIKQWSVSAERILLITGAGISVDSGIPTYRGVTGLYDQAGTEDGIPIEVALSGGMFQRNPDLTWKYLMQIANACRGKKWNRGHQIIVELEENFKEVWVLTQNIDGFHQDAGSRNVIEIHGTMRRLRCTQCGRKRPVTEISPQAIPPACDVCDGVMRPDVVLFDERLPDDAVQTLEKQLVRGFDGILVVGTSALFPYISNPVQQADRESCLTVEINPAKTDLSNVVDFRLEMGATQGLQLLQDWITSS